MMIFEYQTTMSSWNIRDHWPCDTKSYPRMKTSTTTAAKPKNLHTVVLIQLTKAPPYLTRSDCISLRFIMYEGESKSIRTGVLMFCGLAVLLSAHAC